MIHAVPVIAGGSGRHWHHSCDASFADINNARMIWLYRLPLRFHRKGWKAQQDMAGLKSLQASPERVMCESLRVKLKLQWRIQKVRDSRNMEYLPEAAGKEWSAKRITKSGTEMSTKGPCIDIVFPNL